MMQRLMFFSLFLLLIGSTSVDARWWIFGQSQDEVLTRNIFLNDISYDELGEQVTLYRDMLPAGRVEIRGRGQSGKNRIGAAEISLDGGQSWQKIDLSRDGSFYFRFTPDINREYDLALRLLDTSGKSSDVDATRKKLTVSDRNIQSIIREALDAMMTAYQFKNERDFMIHVDPNFAGDAVILERAIRKDFTILDQIDMRYTLNNVVSGSGGKVFAAISFNRQVTVARNGDVLKDKGETEFTFALTGDKARVSAMKNPLIFGLSERESVAQGDVNQPNNEGNLIIPDDGGLPYVGTPDGRVPTPTNLRYDSDADRLSFDYPISGWDNTFEFYNVLLQKQSGITWTTVYTEQFSDPGIGNVKLDYDSGFYQIVIESRITGEQSRPSNSVFVH